MIWSDTAKSVYDAIRCASVYNAARNTTPPNLNLIVMNQAKDFLCMARPWRDLRVVTQLTLDDNRQITLPSDFGRCLFVYSDTTGQGKPEYYFYLNDNDISRRYTEDVTVDDNNVFTRKFTFPVATPLSGNPYVVYIKNITDYTIEDVEGTTKYSFFPITLMVLVAKKMFQDYYGVPAHQDPKWISLRVEEELQKFSSYALSNNITLEKSIKDRNGNPVYINGMRLDGRPSTYKRPSPYYPSTLITGGTY